MGKVYHEFFLVQQHIEGLKGMPEERREQVTGLWVDRWNQGHSPLHAAGYALDPELRTHDFDTEVSMTGLWQLRPAKSCNYWYPGYTLPKGPLHCLSSDTNPCGSGAGTTLWSDA